MNQNSLKKTEIFEKKVCSYLLIDPKLFDLCVYKYKGYALLLRNWIEESYLRGTPVHDVVRTIRNSKLLVEQINMGKPLCWA